MYSTDIDEQLLREIGLGGGRCRSGSRQTPAMNRTATNSAKGTGKDLNGYGVHVRVWNLPKKKNIHKDLNLAFKGFPGLVNIEPAVSANKKTRDPICKGFAYLKLESVEAATRFVELYILPKRLCHLARFRSRSGAVLLMHTALLSLKINHLVVRQSVNPD